MYDTITKDENERLRFVVIKKKVEYMFRLQ